MSHRHGVDVWITYSGAIVDEYQIDGETRTGRIIEEVFVGATLVPVVGDGEATTVSVFQSGTDQPRIARASRNSVFEYRYPSGAVLELRLDYAGRVVRSIRQVNATAPAEARVIRRGEMSHTVDVAEQSQSFVYGSYVGGTGIDAVAAITSTPSGDVVICGTTTQMSYPEGLGGYSKTIKGNQDVFVLRCDPTLSLIKAMTFFGGVENDIARAVCTDAKLSIYVAIESNSPSLPVSTNAQGRNLVSDYDAYVVKFDSALTQIQTAFYHGGNRDEYPRAITVDPSGMIYLAGGTTSTSGLPNNMPSSQVIKSRWEIRPGQYESYEVVVNGGSKNMGLMDGFVAIYSAAGIMQKSRYFGGDGIDIFNSVAVDPVTGYVLLSGMTTSANLECLPVRFEYRGITPSYDYTYNGGYSDGLIVKMNGLLAFGQTDGSFVTYLGGNGDDEIVSVWTDERSTVNVGGTTTSNNIVTNAALFPSPLGMKDGFVSQLTSNGSSVLFSTYFGGSGNDVVRSIRPGTRRQEFVAVGTTESIDYPIAGLGAVSERFGATDGFFTRMSFSSINTSSLLNGAESDTVVDAFVDARGDIVLGATTTSPDLIIREGAFAAYKGKTDGYYAKFSPGTLDVTSPKGRETICIGSTKSLGWNPVGLADTTKYRIQLKREGDPLWTEITQSASGCTYVWKVPTSLTPGRYRVRISSSFGHVSEMPSLFTIDASPTITSQPTGGTVCEGDTIILTVVSPSSLTRYQWMKDGADIPGATASSLPFVSIGPSANGTYKCRLTSECPPAVETRSVDVRVNERTAFKVQPKPFIVDEGAPFTLTVVTTGTVVKHQWFKDGKLMIGADNSTFAVQSAKLSDQGVYTCTATGGCGTVTSDSALVRVNTNTSIKPTDDAETFVRIVGRQPIQDEFTVSLRMTSSSSLLIRLLDQQGRSVRSILPASHEQGDHTFTIPTIDVASGLLIVQVITESGIAVLPVLVQH